ncbi:cyclic nucleotide-binding domain-containing protein [Chloroflexota bacterium]
MAAQKITVKVLKEVNLFKGLTDEELAQVAKLCKQHSHKSGECCVTQGMAADEIHIVRKGRVGVESHMTNMPHGTSDIILATLTDGEIFSWSALLRKKLTATVRVVEPTKIIDINAEELLELCEENCHIGYIVMKNLALVVSSRLTRHRLAFLSVVSSIGEGW